jgi:hypothetical protein
VPQWITRQFVPKAVEETYDALINAAQNIALIEENDS